MAASRAASASTSERRNTSAARAMSPISLLTSVAGIEVCFSPPGERADRAGDRLQRPDGPAHHKQRREQPDQHPGNSEDDALPFVVGTASWRNRWRARGPGARSRSRSRSVTRPIWRPSVPSTSLSSLAISAFGPRDRNDRIGVGVGRGSQRRIVDRQRPHALGGLLGRRRVVRQQAPRQSGFGLWNRLSRGGPVGHLGDRRFEPLTHRRQCRDQFGAARDQAR